MYFYLFNRHVETIVSKDACLGGKKQKGNQESNYYKS